MKKTQKLSLVVMNIPGVLSRVAGRIRNEGWNIRKINVEECVDSNFSKMEMEVNCISSKLSLVVERLLNLDWIISVTYYDDETPITRKRKSESKDLINKDEPVKVYEKISQKDKNVFRILTINPGSTSTKFALYDNENEIFTEVIRHNKEELNVPVLQQKIMRCDCILNILDNLGVEIKYLDAVSGRGGLLKPIESGTYFINDAMLLDLNNASASIHASALGAIIAADIANKVNIPAFVVDPIVVDEMDRNAKLTGMPGLERTSVFHALNQKAIARRHSLKHGMIYENSRLIIAHLGGGISIGAHRYGRVIDVNDALTGEGPFTPERTGALPLVPIIRMCFSGEYTEKEMIEIITSHGGMQAYLGTNDFKKAQRLIDDGDEFAALVMDSMAYQVSKEIGALAAVLEGRVDGILLTGGLAYSTRFTSAIKQRVDRLAPVSVYPGEDEMLALMQGALRILKGEEKAKIYE